MKESFYLKKGDSFVKTDQSQIKPSMQAHRRAVTSI